MDIAQVVTVSKRLMSKRKSHPPTLIIETPDDVHTKVLDALPDTTLEKQKLLFMLGHDMAMEHDIEAKEVQSLIWICEAWFSQSTPEAFPTAPSPSKDPNRQEGLIVLCLTIKGKQIIQDLQLVEVIRHGTILDLLPQNEPLEGVQSGLLTSCLAGIVAASLSESELSEILKKATK